MTKQFDVIPIEDYYVVIDKGVEPEDRKICVSYHKETKAPMIGEYYQGDPYVFPCYKAVATIDKRIDNLPLIEILKENAYTEAEKFQDMLDKTGLDKTVTYNQALGFISGYKAAQSKGTYTEEDMKVVLLSLYGACRRNEIQTTEDVYDFKVKYVQKKKVIKAVVLEGSWMDKWYDKDTGAFLPDVTETNTIIPKEIIYAN